MAGIFKLPRLMSAQIALGKKIVNLSKTVNSSDPNCEWKKFTTVGPATWLHDGGRGYKFGPPDDTAGGPIPTTVTLVPVYDTETTIHVVIPWSGMMTDPPLIEDEPQYSLLGANGFPLLVARYFMRQCR